MIRVARFLDLLLVVLTLGLLFAHVMEIPGKLRLDGPTWLAVQHNLYVGFGTIGAVIEVLAIALTWIVCFLVRHRRPANRWTLLAAICVTAGLIEWAAVVAPMNTRLSGWTAATLPANWTATREQWELGHAIHFLLFGTAFCALLAAILRETPDATP